MFYTIDIAGMKRDLKLFPVSDDLNIAAFILFGDVEITKHAAKKLLGVLTVGEYECADWRTASNDGVTVLADEHHWVGRH